MQKIDPCSPTGRYLDIMRQGFMKPLPKARKPKAEKPIVACSGCMNWHRHGQHTLSPDERKINRSKLNCSLRDEQH